MNCEICDRELNSWTEETPDEFGVQRWESSDPCKMGCDQNEEEDFAGSKEYFLFRANVARTLIANSSVEVNVVKTLASLDEWMSQWWNEAGREAFLDEN